MERIISYSFHYVERCNMCGSASGTHKILGRRLNLSQGRNPKKKIGISTTILRCDNCGLIYANPLPIPSNFNDHYEIQTENYWEAKRLTAIEDYAFKGEIIILKKLLQYQEGAKSLDVGAGHGKTMAALSRAGFDSYGFEPSESFYNYAIKNTGLSADKLRLGMIEDIDYPENHFDFITFGAVLEHLYNPSEAIVKALNWLKPQGIMHIDVPSSRWMVNKIANLYYYLIRTDYVANISPMHSPYHLYEFGLKSFTKHAEFNNYEVAFYQYHRSQKTYLPKSIEFFLIPYMNRTNTGMQLCVWLKKK